MDKKQLLTMSAIAALAFSGGLFASNGNQIEVVSESEPVPVEVTAPKKSEVITQFADCAPKGPVECKDVRGKLYCTDGGTCGFWVADAAVISEVKALSDVAGLSVDKGKLWVTPR